MSTHPPATDHGELIEVFPDVFWLQGTVNFKPGVRLNRVMVVLRHEGELTVINAIRPQDPGMLDALGKVTKLVKIGFHGMDDAWYRDHYDVRYYALEGVEDADVTLGPDSEQPLPWVRTVAFESTVRPELALLVERQEGVLVTCDAVQNWPNTDRCSLMAKGICTWFGFTARPAQIGPPWRKQMTPPGGSLQADFQKLLDLPFDNLIGGHGEPLIGGAKDALAATVAATF